MYKWPYQGGKHFESFSVRIFMGSYLYASKSLGVYLFTSGETLSGGKLPSRSCFHVKEILISIMPLYWNIFHLNICEKFGHEEFEGTKRLRISCSPACNISFNSVILVRYGA